MSTNVATNVSDISSTNVDVSVDKPYKHDMHLVTKLHAAGNQIIKLRTNGVLKAMCHEHGVKSACIRRLIAREVKKRARLRRARHESNVQLKSQNGCTE